MKCFRIDDGGEHFVYAAETPEAAMKEHAESFADLEEDATIRELSEEEMLKYVVNMEDCDDPENYPDGKATLKQVFDDECSAGVEGALYIASSVY